MRTRESKKKKKKQSPPPATALTARLPDDEVTFCVCRMGEDVHGMTSGYRRGCHIQDPEDDVLEEYTYVGWQE